MKSRKWLLLFALVIFIFLCMFYVLAFTVGMKRTFDSNGHKITIKDIYCIPVALAFDYDQGIPSVCAKSYIIIDGKKLMTVSNEYFIDDIGVSDDLKTIAYTGYSTHAGSGKIVVINDKENKYTDVYNFKVEKDGTVRYKIIVSGRDVQMENFEIVSQGL